ncbi:MAG TPA: hypothetical protein VGR35_12685 [Tepidisphaeraceae bacterium]|nr:hypothetical protein [Tepidisphaeraceae bacterium]
MIKLSFTLNRNDPVWAPIHPAAYAQWRGGNQTPAIAAELTRQIVDVVYSVRNNTFHGGKEPEDENAQRVVMNATALLKLILAEFVVHPAVP